MESMKNSGACVLFTHIVLFPHIVGRVPIIVGTPIRSHDPTVAERVLLRECHGDRPVTTTFCSGINTTLLKAMILRLQETPWLDWH